MPLRLLKGFANWLGRSFLGEENWAIAVPFEKEDLRELVSSKILPMRKGWLFSPFPDFRRAREVRGLIEGDAVLLLPPRLGVLGTLFGLNTRFRFAGRMTAGPTGTEISGRYQIVPFARVFMFLWLTGVMAFVALCFGLLLWFLVVGDHGRALDSLKGVGIGLGLLGIVYLLGSITDWVTKPSRDALHAFLTGLSAAKPDAEPETPRA